MKIAKEFHWEMAHRLPYHRSGCQNIHGHSYRMFVEIEGTPGPNGMLMDYGDMKSLVKPIVDELDHAFLCSNDDEMMKPFLKTSGLKAVYVDFFTTAENLSFYFAKKIKEKLVPYKNIIAVKVRIQETTSSYAEAVETFAR
ncbi:6-carboxytetrahydropterin synthase [bacterium]|nr:MAG: 6-carboxytetrahydropterin synthase [bacterium]